MKMSGCIAMLCLLYVRMSGHNNTYLTTLNSPIGENHGDSLLVLCSTRLLKEKDRVLLFVCLTLRTACPHCSNAWDMYSCSRITLCSLRFRRTRRITIYSVIRKPLV